MTINLIRKTTKGKAVRGTLAFTLSGREFTANTLENADFLIPAGTYPLKMTWSPRFKKNMPEICDVPERDGLRFHLGSKPEHSQGCVLLQDALLLENLKSFINYIEKYYEDETLSIQIRQSDAH